MREDADIAACRDQLAHGSRTFLAASLLLPRSVRAPACALYAFCRLADDLIDGPGGGAHALPVLRERLARLYAGDPLDHPADRALARVVVTHRIPITLPLALLEGFEWDVQGRRYADIESLEAYAARVAGTVGAMMSLLMDTRHADALARACDLGVAMQLSNIARDVGEDARLGRLYLPEHWLHQAGLDPAAWLAAPMFDARLAGVVLRLLAHADTLYARAAAGIGLLPAGCRPAIGAARVLYAAIGHEVARRGGDSVSQRAVVPGQRKLALLLGAPLRWRPARSRARLAALPPLAATRFLVEAAADPQARPHTVAARARGVFELIERLERRDRWQQV